MSKKYLYLKIKNKKINNERADLFAKLEIDRFLEAYTIIENSFQLINYSDLNLIISKDISLQNDLTYQLPYKGNHGFLWYGETLPDINKIFLNSAYIYEIYLFQRIGEQKPAF